MELVQVTMIICATILASIFILAMFTDFFNNFNKK